MIEVEKRFQPTEEQLVKMLEGAEFLSEVVLNDIYYDYPDYRLIKKDVRLRKRNGDFELKLGKRSGVAEEIENKNEIEKYFGISDTLESFVKNNMEIFVEYSNTRKSYLKEGFDIGVDDMSFGYKMCEVELLVKNEEEIKDAEVKIINFAKSYGIEIKKGVGKRQEYLRRFKPELYQELYGDK